MATITHLSGLQLSDHKLPDARPSLSSCCAHCKHVRVPAPFEGLYLFCTQ